MEISEARFEHRKKMGLLTYEDLVFENDQLKQRIAELEEEVACANDYAADIEASTRKKEHDLTNRMAEMQRSYEMQKWENNERIEMLERKNERCRLENRKLKIPSW